VLGFAVLASCSSPKHSSAAPDPYATEASFCDTWAKAACNAKVVAGCAATTTDACVATQSQYCAGLVPPNYDSTNAKACINFVKTAYADAKLTADEIAVVRDMGAPCDALAKGPKGMGETCTQSDECDNVGGQSCVIKAGDPSGTCQIANQVGGGSDCSGADAVCDSGFYCTSPAQNVQYYCIKDVADGLACHDPDLPCGPNSQCLGSTGSMSCVPKGDIGASCKADTDCISGICATGSSKCVDSITLTPEAAFCKYLS
jgi:hypothetical protein